MSNNKKDVSLDKREIGVIEISVSEEELYQIVKTGIVKLNVDGTDQFKHLYSSEFIRGFSEYDTKEYTENNPEFKEKIARDRKICNTCKRRHIQAPYACLLCGYKGISNYEKED